MRGTGAADDGGGSGAGSGLLGAIGKSSFFNILGGTSAEMAYYLGGSLFGRRG